MREEFIYYLWRFRLFNSPLITNTGEEVRIIDVGQKNLNAGPDILMCKLKIGNTLWVGNAEIHIHSSDWFRHKHDQDPAYDSIVLHIVLTDDCAPILRKNGEVIPTVAIKHAFDYGYYHRYQHYLKNKNWIPCYKQLSSLPPIVWMSWRERLLIRRLERKSHELELLIQRFNNNWDEAFYVILAGYFGMKVNKLPFELLALSLPLKILLKHRDNLLQLEALLFGQSGLLPENSADAYVKVLQHEYDFLKRKYGLEALSRDVWKFLRLRPANFPTIRISQFAMLFYTFGNSFGQVRLLKESASLRRIFELEASEYWSSHYSFDKKSDEKVKILGKSTREVIIINAVIPMLFLYGKQKMKPELVDRALAYYMDLPTEQNTITRHFRKIGISCETAMDSQACIELKQHYCRLKRCLDCAIGHHLLKTNK